MLVLMKIKYDDNTISLTNHNIIYMYEILCFLYPYVTLEILYNL